MEQWVTWNWSCDKRDDDTWLNSDLARIGELGRGDVSHHDRTQRKIVYQLWDPERWNRLLVFTTIDRHFHNPRSMRHEIIAAVHGVREMIKSPEEIESWDERQAQNEACNWRKWCSTWAYPPLIYIQSWVWISNLCAKDLCNGVSVRRFTCMRVEPEWVLSFFDRLWCEATHLESINGKLRKIILYWSRGTQKQMRWRDSFSQKKRNEGTDQT